MIVVCIVSIIYQCCVSLFVLLYSFVYCLIVDYLCHVLFIVTYLSQYTKAK